MPNMTDTWAKLEAVIEADTAKKIGILEQQYIDLGRRVEQVAAENERLRETLTSIQQRARSMTGTPLGAPMEERRIWQDMGKQAAKALGA